MSVNFTPDFADYTGVGAFKWWAQSVIPLVYDDSLSYYEVLCKVTDYLNKVIKDLGATETNVDALREAYDLLQGYVNDYFDNLDVQDEINKKLDNLIINGTLSNLIAPIVQGYSAPVFVDATNKMTDPTKTYVLTTNGRIYNWNGSKFNDTGMTYDINGLTFIYRGALTSNKYNIDNLTESGFYYYTNGIMATGLDYTKFTSGQICLYADGTGNINVTIFDKNGNCAFGIGEGSPGSWTWNYHLAVDDTLTIAGAPGDAYIIGKTIEDINNKLAAPTNIVLDRIKFNRRDTALGQYIKDNTTYSWRFQSMVYNRNNSTVYTFCSNTSNDGKTQVVKTDLTFDYEHGERIIIEAGHANQAIMDYERNVIIIVCGSNGMINGEVQPGWIGQGNNIIVEYNIATDTAGPPISLPEWNEITGIGGGWLFNGLYYMHGFGAVRAYDKNWKYQNIYFTTSKRDVYMDIIGRYTGTDEEGSISRQSFFTDDKYLYSLYFARSDFGSSGPMQYTVISKHDPTNYKYYGSAIYQIGIQQEIEAAFYEAGRIYFLYDGRYYTVALYNTQVGQWINSDFTMLETGDNLDTCLKGTYVSNSNKVTLSLINKPPFFSGGSAMLWNLRFGSGEIIQIFMVSSNSLNQMAMRFFSSTTMSWNTWQVYHSPNAFIEINSDDATNIYANRLANVTNIEKFTTTSSYWQDVPVDQSTPLILMIENIRSTSTLIFQRMTFRSLSRSGCMLTRLVNIGTGNAEEWRNIGYFASAKTKDYIASFKDNEVVYNTFDVSPVTTAVHVIPFRLNVANMVQFAIEYRNSHANVWWRNVTRDNTDNAIKWNQLGDIKRKVTTSVSSTEVQLPLITIGSNEGPFIMNVDVCTRMAKGGNGFIKFTVCGDATTSTNISQLIINKDAILEPANNLSLTIKAIGRKLVIAFSGDDDTGIIAYTSNCPFCDETKINYIN